MKSKIHEIRQALNLGLYDSALSLSLTLPSICARVEYCNTKNDDKRKYIDWFDKYAKDEFTFETLCLPINKIVFHNTLDGLTCYKLRCAVLHAGNFEVDEGKYTKIVIHGHNKNSKIFEHEYTNNGEFHLDINKFCNTLCSVVEAYYDSYEDKTKFMVDNVVVLDW